MPIIKFLSDMAEESGRLVAGAILLATIGIAGLVINLFIVVNMIRYRRNFGKHTILFMNVAVSSFFNIQESKVLVHGISPQSFKSI